MRPIVTVTLSPSRPTSTRSLKRHPPHPGGKKYEKQEGENENNRFLHIRAAGFGAVAAGLAAELTEGTFSHHQILKGLTSSSISRAIT